LLDRRLVRDADALALDAAAGDAETGA
jgi:hypothetical protein